MLFADFPNANRCKIWYIKGKWFGFGLLYCTKSSTLWGAALFVLHGFYGAVKERIRTARAPRFASRGAETPQWGVSRARLGESLRARQKSPCNVLCKVIFCLLYFCFNSASATYHQWHLCIAPAQFSCFAADLQRFLQDRLPHW